MKSFRMIALEETYVNLYSDKDKETYIDEIWDLLIRSYEDIGGIKGSGFNSKKDMIKFISEFPKPAVKFYTNWVKFSVII